MKKPGQLLLVIKVFLPEVSQDQSVQIQEESLVIMLVQQLVTILLTLLQHMA